MLLVFVHEGDLVGTRCLDMDDVALGVVGDVRGRHAGSIAGGPFVGHKAVGVVVVSLHQAHIVDAGTECGGRGCQAHGKLLLHLSAGICDEMGGDGVLHIVEPVCIASLG